jgi:hypothetical protein
MANDDTIALGLQAGSLAAAMRPFIAKRESTALARLVQEHRDGTLTEASMRSGIAEIAALRGLTGDLDALSRHGHAVMDREVNGSTRPGR